MRHKLLVWLLAFLLGMFAYSFAVKGQADTIEGQLTQDSSDPGYFAIGNSISLYVKEGSQEETWLNRHLKQTISLQVVP